MKDVEKKQVRPKIKFSHVSIENHSRLICNKIEYKLATEQNLQRGNKAEHL